MSTVIRQERNLELTVERRQLIDCDTVDKVVISPPIVAFEELPMPTQTTQPHLALLGPLPAPRGDSPISAAIQSSRLRCGILCVFIGCSAVLGSSLSLIGCAPGPKSERPKLYEREPLRAVAEPSFRPLRYAEIGILPLQASDPSVVRDETVRELTPALVEAFDAFSSLHVANVERASDVDSATSAVRSLAVAQRDRAHAFGRSAKVDGVLFGQVSRYVESSGSRLGADQSAAVSFSLSLLDVASGKVVWTASFDRRDIPLTENLYRIGEPIAFQSTRAMADEGFREAAQEFERQRLAAQSVTSKN